MSLIRAERPANGGLLRNAIDLCWIAKLRASAAVASRRVDKSCRRADPLRTWRLQQAEVSGALLKAVRCFARRPDLVNLTGTWIARPTEQDRYRDRSVR
jgi:hypothetical protein